MTLDMKRHPYGNCDIILEGYLRESQPATKRLAQDHSAPFEYNNRPTPDQSFSK